MPYHSTLEQLRKDWPKRTALTASEVAQVLGRDGTSRGVVQKVREGMSNGRYKGARKIDGRWQLPLDDLARILDPEQPSLLPPEPRQGRRRASVVGPKWMANASFFVDVFTELGEEAQALLLRDELVQAWHQWEERTAHRQRKTLIEHMPEGLPPKNSLI